jgi:hypothetical protein
LQNWRELLHVTFLRTDGESKSKAKRPRSQLLMPDTSDSRVTRALRRAGAESAQSMKKALTGPTTKNTRVATKAPAAMRINSESVSNEIDESDLPNEKESEHHKELSPMWFANT